MELQLGFSLGLGKFMGDLATTKYGSLARTGGGPKLHRKRAMAGLGACSDL